MVVVVVAKSPHKPFVCREEDKKIRGGWKPLMEQGGYLIVADRSVQ